MIAAGERYIKLTGVGESAGTVRAFPWRASLFEYTTRVFAGGILQCKRATVPSQTQGDFGGLNTIPPKEV